MRLLYVLLPIAAVLGLVAGQMLVLRHKWMEYAVASLQIRAIRPRVFLRTLLACFVSGVYVVACDLLGLIHDTSHWRLIECVLCCVPAVIFFFFVPLPPAWLIATFGTAAARVIWSIIFGAALPLMVILFFECLVLYSVFS